MSPTDDTARLGDRSNPQTVAERLSLQILDTLRSVGTERGVEVALVVLFFRWASLKDVMNKARWDLMAASTSDDEHREAVETFLREFLPRELARAATIDRTAATTMGALTRLVAKEIPGRVAAEGMQSAALTFEALLSRMNQSTRESGERETPVDLARLLVGVASRRQSGSILDPACGQGNALLAAALQAPSGTKVAGIELVDEVARLAWMRLIIHDLRPSITLGDAFQESHRHSADTVVLQPPWGLKFNRDQKAVVQGRHVDYIWPDTNDSAGVPIPDALTQGEFPWLLLAQQALHHDGRAAVALTHHSVSSRWNKAHQHLLRERGVEAVIALPSDLFAHTSVRSVVWVLRRPDPAATDRDSLLFVDGQGFLPSRRHTSGDTAAQGIDGLVSLVEQFRQHGTVTADEHVARVVHLAEIDDRGLAPLAYLAPPPDSAVAHPEPKRRLMTGLTIENFKSFGQQGRVPLAPLTLIYGANSAGKSTVIQSLLLLKQSIDSQRLVTQGDSTNVGSFSGILHGHRAEALVLGIDYGVPPTWIPDSGTPDPALPRAIRWTFERDMAGLGNLTHLDLGAGDHHAFYTTGLNDPQHLQLSLDKLEPLATALAATPLLYQPNHTDKRRGNHDEAGNNTSRANTARRVIRNLRTGNNETLDIERDGLVPTATAVVPWAITQALPDIDRNYLAANLRGITGFGAGIGAELRNLLSNVVYLGPLRSAPQRFYDRAATATSNVGDGRHVAMYLFDNTSVVRQVNEWLATLEVPYKLDLVPVEAAGTATLVGDLVAIVLEDQRSGVTVTPADVGFGISQVLPIIVELLARRESIVCIEQPETHLHPRLQARLADLLIETIEEGGRGNQVVVETHSEHLMLRVQRRIREGTLDPAAVSVVYVDQTADGQAVVKPLRLTNEGDFIDDWPQGFFDDRLEELFGEF